jgi:APA family basic amino acid/polyamine antiporter
MGVTNHGKEPAARTVGLFGATGVGVGAIVGGGILVLAGVAFQATGPSALLAFALNGVVAVLTALSYAEISTTFPENGGTYAFANKVLSVRAAFAVGWILWLAYVVAAVLYALGFAEYAVAIFRDAWVSIWGRASLPSWLAGHQLAIPLAVLATVGYAGALVRRATGGGQLATIGKVVVFLVLIVGGFWALSKPSSSVGPRLTPFFFHGGLGLLQAMGFTFIALQGFDLIPAIAGEVKAPTRTIPRAMLLSLGWRSPSICPCSFWCPRWAFRMGIRSAK